ncbi:MAG: TIGR03617 family F420-dependent LLM class oxidoreductase [Acidimicrobiia bacterium]
MKIDAPLVATRLAEVPAASRALETAGFDGAYTFEGPHDPFLPLLLASEHTDHIDLMTAVAIAFARNPMSVAHLGWDLEAASGGRAVIGLGSQIRAHVERRFSMPWSAPAARMREFVEALRAIWACWQDDAPLRFEGDHYRHTLMTAFFRPEPLPCGPPRVFLAGIGPMMTSVAADVADGFFAHPFTTPAFLRECTLPTLGRGERGAGPDFEVAWPVMVATGLDDESRAAAELATRAQIAFYASTPAYRPVLDHHGLGDLQPELRQLTQRDDWAGMVGLVDDALFDLVAVRGSPAPAGAELAARTVGLVDRAAINAPYPAEPEVWSEVLKAFRTAADTIGETSVVTPPKRTEPK